MAVFIFWLALIYQNYSASSISFCYYFDYIVGERVTLLSLKCGGWEKRGGGRGGRDCPRFDFGNNLMYSKFCAEQFDFPMVTDDVNVTRKT